MEETKQTGFHQCFATYTDDFVEYNGYWLANEMAGRGAVAEYWACREKAAITDLSPLRKYEVTGSDAEALLQYCATRDIKELAVGRIAYTAMCYEHGGMVDDGTIYRLAEDDFRWVGGGDDSGLWLREQAEKNGFNASVRESTEEWCNVAVQGRLSRDILKPILWTPSTQPTIEELAWFGFSTAHLGDSHGPACVVSRTGYSGELGYELFCHPKDANTFFDAIWKTGEPLGLAPLGLAALDMLRIEAGLIFAGYEFCPQTNPFEAGIAFTVPLKTKTDDFMGKAALIERAKHPQRVLVGLRVEGDIVPSRTDSIYLEQARVGEITSAVRSPILDEVISLARLDVAHSSPQTEVEIQQSDEGQERLRATVVPIPHFDPTKSRVKGNYTPEE